MIAFNEAPAHWDFLNAHFKEWLSACGRQWGFSIGRLHYRFLDNKAIEEANAHFLNHHYATDIITFPYALNPAIQAEMLIGWERVEEQARERGEHLVDEAARVMVHGLLHCMGFDDRTEDAKRQMRSVEDYCLLLRAKKL